MRQAGFGAIALALVVAAGAPRTAGAQQPAPTDTSRAARDSARAGQADTSRTARDTARVTRGSAAGEVVPTRVSKDDPRNRMPPRRRPAATTPAPTPTTTTPAPTATPPTDSMAAPRTAPVSPSTPDSTGAMRGTDSPAVSAARAAAAPIVASMQTDAHALALLHESNVGEIQAGQRAQREASDSAVRAFAAMMVTEHTVLDEQGMALGQRVGVTPALPDSTLPQLQMRELQALPTGTGMQNAMPAAPRDSMPRDSTAGVPPRPDSASTMPVAGDTTSRASGTMPSHAGMAMGGAAASSFDRAYVTQQVAAHARTLALVDAAIARAQQAELRTMLESRVRPSVAAHLQQAQQLQQRLGGQ